MNSTKYQVFISSTYSDLVEERESIIKAILEMYHIPIGMEMFSAEDEDQWEIIRRTIEVSDYYILILGLRYGSKTSDGISFTQKEYEYALERKIPVLAFVMDEMVSISKDKRDDNLTEMNSFRELVLKNSKMAQFWKTKEELIKNVSISLMKQIMQKPAVGWIRGDKLGSEEALTQELASLSKENRQLRDKIADLESKISPKAPKIEIKIASPKVDDGFDKFKKEEMPKLLKLDDIEPYLRGYISNADIEKFNHNLPTESELENYNLLLERKFKIDRYSSPLIINVLNTGSIKANNLYVDITFPKTLFIYEKNQEFVELESPFPPHPKEKAKALYEEEQKRALIAYQPLGMSIIDNDFAMANIFEKRKLDIEPINQSWWTKLDENKLTVKLNNLLHTRGMKFEEEFLIVPLTLGKHLIEVEVICEEYDGIKNQIVEMVV